VTGHSLGGATALLVASHYHIPAKVYSAPDPWKVMTNKERLWSVSHPELLLNYRHEGDLLSDIDSKALRINGATGTTVWTKSTQPGHGLKTHNLSTFVFNQAGKIKIVPNLNEDLNLYQGKLTALKSLAKSMAKSGGKMHHSEKIFLDVAEALAMSASLTKMATDGLDQIIKECHTAIDSFDPIWQDTIKTATSFAEHCSHAEIMAALADGGATKKTMVDDPTAEFTAKIKQARKIKEDYVTLGKNVKAAVNKVVADDQELAQEFS
jgi:Putative lipase essential for disintegration of autophagic bodies inside the vacuole